MLNLTGTASLLICKYKVVVQSFSVVQEQIVGKEHEDDEEDDAGVKVARNADLHDFLEGPVLVASQPGPNLVHSGPVVEAQD